MAWFALHLAQVLFTLARDLFNFGLVALHLTRSDLLWLGPCLSVARFALHLAQVLFTLARALFNFGLVCPAFSLGLVYFA